MKRKVVVTGAAGYIFSRMMDDFRQRYDLTLLDVRKQAGDRKEIADVQSVDLTDRNRNNYRAHFGAYSRSKSRCSSLQSNALMLDSGAVL